MTQERTADADTTKVDANAKDDAPDASDTYDASGDSKIDTPKINVKRRIGKPYAVAIALSRQVSLRQQALHDTQFVQVQLQ